MRQFLLLFLFLSLISCSRNTEPPQLSSPEPTATVTATILAPTATPQAPQAIGRPIAKADVKRSGQLILIEQNNFPDFRIGLLDLATNTTTSLFDVPQNAWVYQIDLAHDGSRLAFSYTPPPDDGVALFDRSGIYLLSLDEPKSEPTALVAPDEANIYYYNPIWSPDGRYLFYVSFTPDPEIEGTFDVQLMRYELASGESKKIADDGVWPRVSADGQHLTYITVDPESLERGIVVTDLDGNNLVELIPSGTYFDIDSPLFSPDNQWIYFTVAREGPSSSRNWWEWLANVQIASAHTNHNIPSAWWRIPLAGGSGEQLTAEEQIIIYGAFDDTGQTLYFSTFSGLWVMDAEGGYLEQLAKGTMYSTLNVRNAP